MNRHARTGVRHFVAVVVFGLSLAACEDGTRTVTSTPTPVPTATPSPSPSVTPTPQPPPAATVLESSPAVAASDQTRLERAVSSSASSFSTAQSPQFRLVREELTP